MRRTLPLLLSLLLAVPFPARAQDDEEAEEGEKDEKNEKAEDQAERDKREAREADEKREEREKAKGDSTESKEMRFDDVEITKKRKKKSTDQSEKPEPDDTEKKVADEKNEKKNDSAIDAVKSQILTILEEDKPLSGFARHRYGYIIGAGFLVTGLAFAYSSQGEAKRAETIGTAREASQALEAARASAATANVVYGMAIAALTVTLLFELIPQRFVEKASLTFHF